MRNLRLAFFISRLAVGSIGTIAAIALLTQWFLAGHLSPLVRLICWTGGLAMTIALFIHFYQWMDAVDPRSERRQSAQAPVGPVPGHNETGSPGRCHHENQMRREGK